jgi:L-amino acid N-acyltransferase
MQHSTIIRPITPGDHKAVIEIWNPFIRNSDATFNDIEKTPDILKRELELKAVNDFPFLVAEYHNQLLGFATYGQFRASSGYRRTMESTIFLTPDANGKGMGRALMTAIENHARARQVHSVFAGISHRNPDGIAFHAALGYREIARLPEVGFKFARWYDLILMQKIL